MAMTQETLDQIAVAEVVSHLGNKINKLNTELRAVTENMAKTRAGVIAQMVNDDKIMSDWIKQCNLLKMQVVSYQRVLEIFTGAIDAQ